MLKGLRTIVYHVTSLEVAKLWYSQMFKITPYFDESYYVGFDIGGFELGLDPSPEPYTKGNNSITYWKVDSISEVFDHLKRKKVYIHEDIHSVGEGIWVGSVKDPFGNIIGLIEIKE
jgi:predicted enzyme related to lactoylglutathione lyase